MVPTPINTSALQWGLFSPGCGRHLCRKRRPAVSPTPQAVELPADLQHLGLHPAVPCWAPGAPLQRHPSLCVYQCTTLLKRVPGENPAGHKWQGWAWRRALCWVVVFILRHWTSAVALQVLTKELCAVWSELPQSPYTRWGTQLTRPVRVLSPECRAVCSRVLGQGPGEAVGRGCQGRPRGRRAHDQLLGQTRRGPQGAEPWGL